MGISQPLQKFKYHLTVPTDNTYKNVLFLPNICYQKLSLKILRCSWLKVWPRLRMHGRIFDYVWGKPGDQTWPWRLVGFNHICNKKGVWLEHVTLLQCIVGSFTGLDVVSKQSLTSGKFHHPTISIQSELHSSDQSCKGTGNITCIESLV